MTSQPVAVSHIETPLGWMRAAASPVGIQTLAFVNDGEAPSVNDNHAEVHAGQAHLESLCDELARYFAGNSLHCTTPLDPEGTPFQHRVWDQLRAIPFGETVSYSALARRMSQPNAVRAVARANAQNPIAILIPCHRVIGADGTLTGYAGGLDRKRALLELEGVHQLFAQGH